MSTTATTNLEAKAKLKAQQVLASIGRVTALDPSAVTVTLQSAFLSTPSMSSLKTYFTNPASSQSTCTFDGTDLTEIIEHLGNAAMAAQIAVLNLGCGFPAMAHRELALKVPEDKFNMIMPCVLADHINTQFKADNLDPMKVLMKDKHLVNAFKDLIIDPVFNPFGYRGDLHFGMTCLFVYEYFIQGGDFKLQTKVTESQGVALLETWKKNHPLPPIPTKATNPISTVKGLSAPQKAVLLASYLPSATFSPTGKANATLQDYALALQKANLVPPNTVPSNTVLSNTTPPSTTQQVDIEVMITTKTIFDGADVSYYYATSYTLWNAWMETVNDTDNTKGTNFWVKGVVSAATNAVKTSKSGIVESNRLMMNETDEYTTCGTDLISWYKKNMKAPFLKNNVPFDNVSVVHDLGPSTSCFVAGTLVETSTGPMAIEALQENDVVLTRAGTFQQWGLCSNEIVESAAPDTLYGFNGGNAFFTAGHPFHTTTGIRAVDPTLARIENPWLDVGTLRVGHQLLRLNDTRTGYDLETIANITSVPKNVASVYGVHLRQGLRTYHANGYLVALNYPEITAAAIGKQLQALPKQERLQVLRSFVDLKPLFARFGAGAVVDRLAREVQSLNPLAYGGRPANPECILSRDIDRLYSLRHRDQNTSMGAVELHSGSLYVDSGRVVQVDMKGSSLSWTRQLPDSTWEHAHCNFERGGNRASGFLVRTGDEASNDDGASLQGQEVIPFVLNAASTVKRPLSEAVAQRKKEETKGNPMSTEGIPVSETMLMASAAPATNSQYLWDYSYPVYYDPTPPVKGVAVNCTLPCGNLLLPLNANYHVSWPRMQVEEFEMIKIAMQQTVAKEVPDKTKIDVSNFGSLYTCAISYDENGNEVHTYELQTPEMVICCSDEYQAWQSRQDPNDDTPFPQDNLHFTKQLGMPSTFSIEKLYKAIHIVISIDGESLTGFIFPYSAEADGNRGTPLAITSQKSDDPKGSILPPSRPPPPLTTDQDTFSTAVAQSISSNIAILASSPVNDSPSAITAFLKDHTDASTQLQALLNLPYDAPHTNQDVQTMMVQVMQYHMDDADRLMFFGTTQKPDNLDPTLGPLLDSAVSSWIKTEYAPAYICQMMTTNDANIGTQYRFSNKEIKRINYWWSGKGKGCLAANPQYKLLDRAVQRFVTRDKYKLVNTLWSGGEGSDGTIWSDLLYHKVTSDPMLFAELQNSNKQTGTAQLTKICSIMDALDEGHQRTLNLSQPSLPPLPQLPQPTTSTSGSPATQATAAVPTQSTAPIPPPEQEALLSADAPSSPPIQSTGTSTPSKSIVITDTNANLLSLKVLASVRSVSWCQQFWGISQMTDEMVKVVESQWLSELIQELLLGLLKNAPGLQNKILQQINQDIAEAEANDQSWASQSDQWKMEQLFLEFSGSISNFMTALCMAGRAAKAGVRAVAQYFGGAGGVNQAVNQVIEDERQIERPGFKAKLSETAKRGFWTIIGIAALYCAANNLSGQWSDTDTAERGLMITTIVASSLQILEFGVDAWDAYLRFGGGIYSNTTQMMMARQLDVFTGDALTTKGMILDSSARGGGSLNPETFKRNFVDHNASVVRRMNAVPADQANDLQTLMKNSKTVVGWRRGFNIARSVLAWFGYAMAVAVVIFMTWQLVKDWSSMSTGQKIFSTIQTVLAAIEGGIGGAIIVLGGAWAIATMFGFSAAAAGIGSGIALCCTVFAAVGPVLAALAVIVLIAFFVWQSKQPAPPSPVETWLNTKGKAWADSVDMPDCPIDVSLSPTSVESSESIQTITITVKNTGSTTAISQTLYFQFTSGAEDSALFYDEYTFTSASTNGTAGTATMQTIDKSVTMTIWNSPSTTNTEDSAMTTKVTFAGPTVENPLSLMDHNDITLAPSDTIILQLSGKIWSAAGKQASIVVNQGWNDDSWNNTLFLQRSSAS